ncbi:MAG TPA: hypothetical protein VKV27_08565 [Solirubrobacteraceae bacterium]|nr:hypothetical protein [Solirubrobacteraceae bacterium]
MSLEVAREMLAVEILRLRRNRVLMAFSALLAIGSLVLMFCFEAVQHASSPATNAPAGGTVGFDHAVRMLGLMFGVLAAALIGTEAGTADLSSGVFRDLVATGRSRLALFAFRAPAAILVTLALDAVAFAIAIVATFLLAGGQPDPTLAVILQSAAWIVLSTTMAATLAVGVGSVSGSRGVTLTGVLGWLAIATPLLINVSSLGSVREGIMTVALSSLMPVSGGLGASIAVPTAVAVAVLAGWLAVPTALGAWKTVTGDA